MGRHNPSRRSFLKTSTALAWSAPVSHLLGKAIPSGPDAPLVAYVGTFSSPLHDILPTQVDLPPGNGRGILLFRIDRYTGRMTPMGDVEMGVSPSCLALNRAGTFLYSANETDRAGDDKQGSISAFAVNRTDGRLQLCNTVRSGGAGPTYVSIHPTGRHLLVANYFGGSVAVLPILADGRLGDPSDVKVAGGRVGPTKATHAPPGSFAVSGHDRTHAHMIQADPSERFVLHADLGLDKIFVWKFDKEHGVLASNDPPSVSLPPGDGPRHFHFHPNGRWFYSIQEEGSTIVLFDYDSASREIHTFSATAVNEARFGYNFVRTNETPRESVLDSDVGISRPTAATFPGLPLILLARESAGALLGSSPITVRGSSPSLSLVDVFSTRRGQHDLRMGGEFRRYRWDAHANVNAYGEIDFPTFNDFLAGSSDFSSIGVGLTDRNFRASDYALFAQDDWRVSPRLTVNLGLRYELDLPPYDTKGRIGGFDPAFYQPRLEVEGGIPVGPPVGGIVMAGNAIPQYDLAGVPKVTNSVLKSIDPNNLGPRVGFAWSPLNSGRLVVRGGYGIFIVVLLLYILGSISLHRRFTQRSCLSGRISRIHFPARFPRANSLCSSRAFPLRERSWTATTVLLICSNSTRAWNINLRGTPFCRLPMSVRAECDCSGPWLLIRRQLRARPILLQMWSHKT
jgi:6-phosphogluconolactonase (cycloisomerase 2 family)